MWLASRVLGDFAEDFGVFLHQKLVAAWHVSRLYLHDIDAEVAHKWFKISRLWRSAGVLPDFESAPAPHVERQYGMAAAWLAPRVGQHELGLRRLFKNRHIEAEMLPLTGISEPAPPKPTGAADAPSSLDIDDIETWAIIKALGQTSGNVSQAARVLGISRDTLHTKLKKKNIDRESAIAAGAAGG